MPWSVKESLTIQECHKLDYITRKESDMQFVHVSVKKSIIFIYFSFHRHKVFKRVHKVTKTYYSKILNKNLRFVISMKAYRCIMKMGSIDNYILLTKPKDLDSKMG